MPDQLTQVLQQALQRNAKSTVLKAIGGLVTILSAAAIFASKYGLDEWLVVMFAALDCLAILVFIAFFIYFAIKDPDLLRSEKYSIQKMALQQGLVGDDLSGFFKIKKVGDMPLIEDVKKENKEEK